MNDSHMEHGKKRCALGHVCCGCVKYCGLCLNEAFTGIP